MYHFKTRYDRYWVWHDAEMKRQWFLRLMATSRPLDREAWFHLGFTQGSEN